MTTKTITRADAVRAVELLLSNHLEGEQYIPEVLDDVIYAVTKDLQVRDYLMGLPAEHAELSVSQLAGFIKSLLPLMGNEASVPFHTVLCAYLYENGDTYGAVAQVSQALKADPDYSLAKLLVRVIEAEWLPSAFAQMRNELHSKVKAELDDTEIK